MIKGAKSLGLLDFWRLFSLRHARQELFQTLLLVGVLGLGVGTFLSIRIANRSAVEGFQLFTESLRGDSDWIIEAAGDGIAIADLRRIRDALDPLPAEVFPVFENSLQLPGESFDGPAFTVRLLGLDLVQLRSALLETDTSSELFADSEFWPMLDDPQHVLLSAKQAGRMGLNIDDAFTAFLLGERLEFRLAGILPEYRGNTPLPENLAIVDIAALRKRLPITHVTRVEIVFPGGSQRDQWVTQAGEQLRATAPPGWNILSAVERTEAGASMTAAFRLNLAILSLIALLVSLYLIAQSLDATVSRRRREIATLRSLGLEPARIRALWMSEAVLYGVAGAAAGIAFGWALAHITVTAVTTTVRALYRDTVTQAVELSAADITLVLVLSLVGSLVAAWIPARDAATTPPAQFLRIGKRIPPFPLFAKHWLGWLLLLMGAAAAMLPPWQTSDGRSLPLAGYFAALFLLVGMTIVSAAMLPWIGRLMAKAGTNSPTLKLAAGRIQQTTSRHQLAMAGFVVSIAMAAAMGFLINSFDRTVTGWLEVRLQGDLFISNVGFQGSDTDPRMPPSAIDQIRQLPQVLAMDRFTSLDTRIGGVTARLGASDWSLIGSYQNLLWLQPPADDVVKNGDFGGLAIANESLARRLQLRVGDTVNVLSPAGEIPMRIVAIQSDFSRDGGLLLVDLKQMQKMYPIRGYDTATIFVRDGTDPAQLQQQLSDAYPFLRIQQNPELRATALSIFNQTFAVTRSLQWMGLIVAISGLVLSLVSLLRESGQELALQRALGMRRSEIALTTAWEGTAIAAAGLIAGLLLSAALGWLLIFVINLQSFGWTLLAAFPVLSNLNFGAGLLLFAFGISWLTGWLYQSRHKPNL